MTEFEIRLELSRAVCLSTCRAGMCRKLEQCCAPGLGQITGFGLNLGIVDDYAKGRADANSKQTRDKTWLWFADDFLTRFAKDNAFLGIATRWHIDDLFGRLKKKWPDLRALNFPALAEKDEGWRNKGDPLFPEHRPLEMWLDQKRVMSESSWAAEYQGHPFLVGSGEIPIEKLKILTHFDRREVSATVLSVDKAGTEGGDGAYTAIVIMNKMKNGTYIIERVIRGHSPQHGKSTAAEDFAAWMAGRKRGRLARPVLGLPLT